MSDNAAPTPGMRVLCRDAEWLVTKVEFSDRAHSHHVQVGMILSELMRRGRADRILVLAKKSMLTLSVT